MNLNTHYVVVVYLRLSHLASSALLNAVLFNEMVPLNTSISLCLSDHILTVGEMSYKLLSSDSSSKVTEQP